MMSTKYESTPIELVQNDTNTIGISEKYKKYIANTIAKVNN